MTKREIIGAKLFRNGSQKRGKKAPKHKERLYGSHLYA
jgi:hypothetical protein